MVCRGTLPSLIHSTCAISFPSIRPAICTCSISAFFNGSLLFYDLLNFQWKSCWIFWMHRGVRQGDPFSPLLFYLAEEILSRGLADLVANCRVNHIKACKNLFVPSHCLYEDDVLVFCHGTLANIREVMQFFEEYGSYYRQIINSNKSKLYTVYMPLSRRRAITSLTGFIQGSIPFSYLGLPLFKGKPKAIRLKTIIDNIIAKMGTWKGRLLSIMGRVQLVNVVISNMLVYYFLIYKWPNSLLTMLSKHIRTLYGVVIDEQNRKCTVLSK